MALTLTLPTENSSTATISCTRCSAAVLVPAELAPALVDETEPLHVCGA